MGFRKQWGRLLATAAAALVTVPLSLLAVLSPDASGVAAAAPRPAVAAVATPAFGLSSDLDSKSVAMVFVRERDGRADNAGKAQCAAPTTVDKHIAANDPGAYPDWHRPGRPPRPSLDGTALSGAGGVDVEAGGTGVLENSPDDASDRIARHRATRYRADVDPAAHVPIRDMTQETDA
jgi:hypothetical protein